jgi:hypothetical protein
MVLANDGWEYVTGDVVGVHDYTQAADELHERFGSEERTRRTVLRGRAGGRRISLAGEPDAVDRRPVVLSEFGGVNLTGDGGAWSGYGHAADPEDYLRQLEALVNAARSPGLAGFCYTQLTDTLQEQNGLTSATRVPKASLERFAAIFGPR